MINNTELTNTNEYASASGSIEAPSTVEIEQGMLPGEKLPAEWWNFYLNLFTNTNNNAKTAFDNLIAELKNVLAIGGITPDGTLTNQLAGLFGRFVFGDDQYGSVKKSTGSADDLTKSGFYTCTSTVTELPGTGANYLIIHEQYAQNASYARQIAFHYYDTGALHHRVKNNGVWSAWSKIWNADNDGSGSGLDADTVDGVNTDQIVYGEATRAVTYTSSPDSIVKSGFYSCLSTGTTVPDATGNWIIIHSAYAGGSTTASQIAFNNATGATWTRAKVASTWGSWYKLWNANNDGSGSGLDADLFDGIDSTYFPFGNNSRAIFTLTNPDVDTIVKTGFYHITGTGQLNTPSLNAWELIHMNHPTANYATQLAFIIADNGSHYVRTNINGTWSSWSKIWNSGNDGSGSGLDADLLDGYEASQFLKIASNGNAVDISGYDIDSDRPTGVYQGLNVTGAPSTDWWWFEVIRYSATYRHVSAYSINQYSSQPGHFEKLVSSGTSYGWVWVNTSGRTLIPVVTADPSSPVTGQMWLRSDL